MSISYIDAHIHLDNYKENELRQLLRNMDESGVESVIAVTTGLGSCKMTQQLMRAYPGRVYAAYGQHPEGQLPSEEELDELLSWIREHADEMIAVGEVGLPYYTRRDAERRGEPFGMERHLALLERFVRLAAELDKPIALHVLHEDTELVCDLLDRYKVKKAHFHYYKGSPAQVERIVQSGWLISFTPDITYEANIQGIAELVPLEQMMAETDGPWPFEGAFKGRMTEPSMVPDVVAKIAEIKRVSESEAVQTILNNTRKFYGIG